MSTGLCLNFYLNFNYLSVEGCIYKYIWMHTHNKIFSWYPIPQSSCGSIVKTHLSDQLQVSKIFKLTRSARILINPQKWKTSSWISTQLCKHNLMQDWFSKDGGSSRHLCSGLLSFCHLSHKYVILIMNYLLI